MLEQTDLGSLNEGSVNRWRRRAGILKASCHEESQVLITWLNSYSQSINWLHRLRLSLYVCMCVVKEEQGETEKLFSLLLNVCAEKWLFILSVTLLCCAASHIAQPPTPTSTSITSHPSLGRYPLFTASTQPFSGLCHLIHADDSRPVIGGVRVAEDSSLCPLHIHYSAFAPSSSSLFFPSPFSLLLSSSSHCFHCCYSLPCALQHSINNLRYQSSVKHPSGTLCRAAQVRWEPNKVLLCLHEIRSLWCVKFMLAACIF